MFTPALALNKAAFDNNVNALPPQAVADGVATVGEIVDRLAFVSALPPVQQGQPLPSGASLPLSAGFVVSESHTVAGAAAADHLTVTVSISHADAVSGGVLVSPTVFQVATYQIPWKSNATLRESCSTVPVNLLSAKQFVQATVTLAGTGGFYSAEVLAAVWSFGGISPDPTPTYTDAVMIGAST